MYFFRFFLSGTCTLVLAAAGIVSWFLPQVKGQTVLILILLNSDMSCVINLKYINTHFKGEGNTKMWSHTRCLMRTFPCPHQILIDILTDRDFVPTHYWWSSSLDCITHSGHAIVLMHWQKRQTIFHRRRVGFATSCIVSWGHKSCSKLRVERFKRYSTRLTIVYIIRFHSASLSYRNFLLFCFSVFLSNRLSNLHY